MNHLLNKLHADHINFIQLLSYMEDQQKKIANCESADLEGLSDAVRYMKEYPDCIHHPLEDVVFKQFLLHHNESHEDILGLLGEHQGMPILTDKLSNMLNAALIGTPQDRKKLSEYLNKYISAQKEHMNLEEARVYPLIDSTLNEQEWDEINTTLEHVSDPLFGKKQKQSFQSLYNKIDQ